MDKSFYWFLVLFISALKWYKKLKEQPSLSSLTNFSLKISSSLVIANYSLGVPILSYPN